MFEQCINQAIISKNKIIDLNKPYKIAKCTVKIEINIDDNIIKGSGFFLKFERNNKIFYCLLTNQHVITSDFIKEKKEIQIKYENETKQFTLKLDEEERIIISFEEVLNLDVTVIEIIPKDKISDCYFLTPNMNTQFDSEIKIQVLQYPCGRTLSLSRGIIKCIDYNNINYFYHNASTQSGSSGSPIVLENNDKVLAIHKGTNRKRKLNVGIFIRNIVEIMGSYIKNGKFKEYYENGNLKYEGNFQDDEYDDENGKFYFENGEIYIGQFKKGKKNGRGFILDMDGNFLKENIKYENDIFINNENESNDKESSYNKIEKNSENKEENNELAKNIFGIFNNKEVKNLLRHAASTFKPVGDSLGMSFCNCQHEVKSHEEIEPGKYKCKECPENSNSCYLLL